MASYNYLPVKSLRLYAEFEYAYTSMNGRNLHDFLPRAIIEWHPDTEVLLSLKYDKLLVRPSLHYLNPAEVREPLAIRAGNSDIVGMHLHKISFDFDWKLPSLSAHLNASYLYTQAGFNALDPSTKAFEDYCVSQFTGRLGVFTSHDVYLAAYAKGSGILASVTKDNWPRFLDAIAIVLRPDGSRDRAFVRAGLTDGICGVGAKA